MDYAKGFKRISFVISLLVALFGGGFGFIYMTEEYELKVPYAFGMHDWTQANLDTYYLAAKERIDILRDWEEGAKSRVAPARIRELHTWLGDLDRAELLQFKNNPPIYNYLVYREAFPEELNPPVSYIVNGTVGGMLVSFVGCYSLLRLLIFTISWIIRGFRAEQSPRTP